MRRLIIIAFVAFGFTSPALAGHCPKDVKLIDAALAKQSNPEVKALRDKGDALHKAGKHQESLNELHEALNILGLLH